MLGLCIGTTTEKENKQMVKKGQGPHLFGQSPTHATTEHLVLSIKTGTVSPKYHVDFDNYFEPTKWMRYLPKSEWQIKSQTGKEARK